MKTQGPGEEFYEENDKSETTEGKAAKSREKNNARNYFFLGVAISLVILSYMLEGDQYDLEMQRVQERLQQKEHEKSKEGFRDA